MLNIDKKYKKVFTEFGLQNQLDKLDEEVAEFKQAIWEWTQNGCGDIDDLCFEGADIKNVVMGICIGVGGTSEEQISKCDQKMSRTIVRLKQGYYDEKEK